MNKVPLPAVAPRIKRKPGQLWFINDNEEPGFDQNLYVLLNLLPGQGHHTMWRVLHQDKLVDWTEDSMSQDTLISDNGN